MKVVQKKWDSLPITFFRNLKKNLEPGFASSVLCEGCVMLWIGKNEEGKLVFGYPDENDEEIVWESSPRRF